jgi:hypothetical protein
MRTIACIASLAALLCAVGCSKPAPRPLTEKEFLDRYGNVPMTPEGMDSIIDDRNRREGRKDTSDYGEAHRRAVSDAGIHLQMLQALDRGDTNMAKKMLLTTLNVDTGFLPEFQKRGKISEKRLQEASAFARGYLDYLAAHTNVIVVPRLDYNMAFLGLADLLKDPADLQRLQQLLESLNWNASKPATNGGGRSGPTNGSQPIRPETNQPPSASGSRN